jgi:hypothetical protein
MLVTTGRTSGRSFVAIAYCLFNYLHGSYLKMEPQTQTLEAKLAALREVENIYRLSKKWQRLTPDEKRPNWEKIADAILRKALGRPVQAVEKMPLRLQDDKHMHEHDRRSARVFDRTLQNGVIDPAALHSFRHGRTTHHPTRRIRRSRGPDPAYLPPAKSYILHGSTDLHYPSHHVQNVGFVPSMHEAPSHIKVERPGPPSDPIGHVPTAAPHKTAFY